MQLLIGSVQAGLVGYYFMHLRQGDKVVVLGHHYQREDIIQFADLKGDSFKLAKWAGEQEADYIVFCGVHFMAETAAILSPRKTVLLPDLSAGCSLAATITAPQLRAWKAEHPGAVVVSYVNTTAEVKAESDYCCTSSNAVEVINAIPADLEILFLPDMFLGAHIRRVTGRAHMHVWMGECHVHAGIDPENMRQFDVPAQPEVQRFALRLRVLPQLVDLAAGRRLLAGQPLKRETRQLSRLLERLV